MLLRRIYFDGNNKMYLGLRVNRPAFLSDSNQVWSFATDFSESLETDMMKLVSSFRDYANNPDKFLKCNLKYPGSNFQF